MNHICRNFLAKNDLVRVFVCRSFCDNKNPKGNIDSEKAPPEQISFILKSGLPAITLPLPSKQQSCQFLFKPYVQKLSDLCEQIKFEDDEVESVDAFLPDGTKISNFTPIDHLLTEDFYLHINGKPHFVSALLRDKTGAGGHPTNSLERLRDNVEHLYFELSPPEEREVVVQRVQMNLDKARNELEPLEEIRRKLDLKAARRSEYWGWACLAGMGIQCGFLARLTWWEYSWDIMEPVTYFVTYSSAIGVFAYYLLTKQSYEYPDAQRRVYWQSFHRKVRESRFDLKRYEELKGEVEDLERELRFLNRVRGKEPSS